MLLSFDSMKEGAGVTGKYLTLHIVCNPHVERELIDGLEFYKRLQGPDAEFVKMLYKSKLKKVGIVLKHSFRHVPHNVHYIFVFKHNVFSCSA